MGITPPYQAPPHPHMLADVSYEYFFPPIFDQQFEDCVANSSCALFDFYYRKRIGLAVQASRTAIYAQAKIDNASGDEDLQDDGLYPTDALEVLQKRGWIPDPDWPYDDKHYLKAPPKKDWKTDLVLKGYASVKPHIEAMRIALAAHGPLFAGYDWPNDWMEPGENNFLLATPDMNSLAGGHQITIVGYSDIKGAFRLRNSWGVEWGDGGYAWVPYTSTNLPQDIFVLVYP